MDARRTEAEVTRAWAALERLYAEAPTEPVVAGARAAAEWTCSASTMTPVTGERAAATMDRVRDESHRSAMVEMGIVPGSREYARGASGWLFWWTGLRPLPPWLRRAVAAA